MRGFDCKEMERDPLETTKEDVEEMVDRLCETPAPQEMCIDIKIELGGLVLERSCQKPDHEVKRSDDWNWQGGNGNCSSGENLSISKQHLSETVIAGTKEAPSEFQHEDDPLFLPDNISSQSLQIKFKGGRNISWNGQGKRGLRNLQQPKKKQREMNEIESFER